MWGGPQEDFETLGPYPTKWPLLDARDKRAVYDPDKGQTNAALFLQLMDKAKGRRFKRVGPLFGMNHRLKNDATKFKDYAVAEKELIEDGNYA
jgi:hypothetical protein